MTERIKICELTSKKEMFMDANWLQKYITKMVLPDLPQLYSMDRNFFSSEGYQWG